MLKKYLHVNKWPYYPTTDFSLSHYTETTWHLPMSCNHSKAFPPCKGNLYFVVFVATGDSLFICGFTLLLSSVLLLPFMASFPKQQF